MIRWIGFWWILACYGPSFSLLLGATPADHPGGVAVRAGKLVTLDDQDRVLNHAVVLMRDGQFEALGPEKELSIPDGYEVIDAEAFWVVPGLVDYHSHVGGSLSDLNDGVYLTNPGLRVDECLEPDNPRIRDAAAAGITTMLVIPGSGNNMAGFGLMFKTGARTPEEAIMTNPGCLKMAQAGNPEYYWYGVGRSFMNWNLRSTLEACKAYHDAWCAYEQGETREAPKFDPAYEPFRDVFRGKVPTCMHTQVYQVCLATFVMMHDLFGFWTVPTHSSFDAYKLAPLAREREIVIIAGPRNLFLDRTERRINGLAAKWAEGGDLVLGTETDAPVVPIEEHAYQASLACRLGWDSYEALKGLCRATAKGAMIDDRVGSIETGKEADLGIWTGDPIDPRSYCVMTIVSGQVIYRMDEGRRY
ncbi:MAG: amidohydrolase family protein [Planctomycetes bacterium]|nr:amidohydrolase family protein [Planctomycetota bacterium]